MVDIVLSADDYVTTEMVVEKLVDTSLNLEERLEDILKTEISSSLYYVYNELVVAILGDMVDIFTYIVFIDNLYQHNNISPYHHYN